jgi:UDP-2,3-diacylglucosamine pyrophosphatase LpxH
MGSDAVNEESPERRFRTLFISDVHPGARGSQADKLLDFLRTYDADTIYLVGDIVDGWGAEIELTLAAIAQRLRAENVSRSITWSDLAPRVAPVPQVAARAA